MTGTRKIYVSFESTNLDLLPKDDDAIYVHLFFKQTAEGKNLEGTIRSNLPFSFYSSGLVERAPLQDLSVIETLAKRNGAIVDYTPAIMQGLEAQTILENERKCFDEGADCCSGD